MALGQQAVAHWPMEKLRKQNAIVTGMPSPKDYMAWESCVVRHVTSPVEAASKPLNSDSDTGCKAFITDYGFDRGV